VPQLRTPRAWTTVRRLLEGEAGFGLIESVMAMSMFAVVSAPLAGVMLAGVATQRTSHERTLAVQTAQTQIEQIRSLPYDSVGVLNGNPAGTVSASVAASQLGIQGLDATVATKVSFMDDAPATSYRTRADYKRVIVTVTRNSDGRRLVQQATYVAPPGAGAYAGQSQGIVIAQIIDLVLNTPLVNATVNLAGGPSTTRNDVTDAAGQVVFPTLLPTTPTQPAYDVTVSAPGYTILKDDLPPASASHTSIVAGQTFQTVLRAYKSCTIVLTAANSNGTPYTGAATATVSSSRGTQSFSFTGPQLTVTSIAGEAIVPNLQYTVRILAPNGTYSVPVQALVPTSYPTELSKTLVATLNAVPITMVPLTVKVVNASGVAQANIAVNVSGGPSSNILLAGTTDATGNAVFSVPSNSSPGYTTTAKNGALTGTATGGVTSATTRTVTIR
jgi:type II secretory pathway pseudopilin PulG